MIPFTKTNVDAAALANGVYRLFDGLVLIYIGCAWGETGTIRGRLQKHHSGAEGRCTQAATHFDYFITALPLTTEENLLREYKENFGRLPRCNDRVG